MKFTLNTLSAPDGNLELTATNAGAQQCALGSTLRANIVGGWMTTRAFRAVVERRVQGGVALKLPIDPAAECVERKRYDATGTVDGDKVRGKLVLRPRGYYLELGPAWCRGQALDDGELSSVSLQPEGPQVGAMDNDISSALLAAPDARRFFESLPTFYRKNYMRWIQGAKRPETRAKRVAEMVKLLSEGKRER